MRAVRSLGASVAMCVAISGSAAAQSSTAKIVSAADKFLASLTEQQRARTVFAFDDDAQRVKWSNFPVRMTPRSGVSYGEMTDTQRRRHDVAPLARIQPAWLREAPADRRG